MEDFLATMSSEHVTDCLESNASVELDHPESRVTRRAVERREVNDGDVCPICHEELTDAEMGPLAFCRWGCGRAVHDECAKLWLTKSDSCVLCGAAWS